MDGVAAGEECRRDVVTAAGAVERFAACCNGGAVFLGDVEIAADLAVDGVRGSAGRLRWRDRAGWPTFSFLTRSARRAVNSGAIFSSIEQTRGRRAALAVERVDHEDDGIERAVKVGVSEDDDGVFAAELESARASGCRRLDFMMAEPVELSPTKPMALMAGCSVSALPASSPMPWTVLRTPGAGRRRGRSARADRL